jgi:hypothetical protein
VPIALAFVSVPAAGVVDENAPALLGSDCKEMCPILPADWLGSEQAQV